MRGSPSKASGKAYKASGGKGHAAALAMVLAMGGKRSAAGPVSSSSSVAAACSNKKANLMEQ